MLRSILLLAAVGILLSGCKGAADVAAVAPAVAASWPVTIQELGAFFCQLRCVDGSLPLLNPSVKAARQQMGDAIFWQRWANDSDSSVDSVEYGGNYFVLAWKFGQQFDLASGAGGEGYKEWNNTFKIEETQDGGTPYKQYFVGPDDGPTSGWVVGDNMAPTGKWKDCIANLTIVKDKNEKPQNFSKAYTRWRVEQVTYDAVVFGSDRQITVATLISEHYDGDSIETSSALERSFYAHGYGRAAWEAWKKNGAGTNRRTGTNWSVSPGVGWIFCDGGNNMRFERADGNKSVNSYHWP